MRRTLLATLLCAALVAMAGCKPEADTEPAAVPSPTTKSAKAPDAGGKTFAVSFQTMNNPFFVDLDAGLRGVIESKGDELITLDAQFDSSKQRNDIADVLLKGCDGIFLNPVNWEGIVGSLKQAQEKGVPVVVVDAPVKDDSLVVSTVASDNVKAGRLAAEALAKVMQEGEVAIVHHSVNKACLDRVQGFTERLAEYPGIKIVDTREGGGKAEDARAAMQDIIGRFPKLAAAFPINDPSALGCISALEGAGKLDQVKVVSVDGSQEAVTAIQAGKLLSTSAQFPKEIGKVSAETLYAHLAGEAVEKDIKVRVELITAENAAEYAQPE